MGANWIERLTKNEKTIEYMKEVLDLMSIDSPEFKDLYVTAITEREIEIRDIQLKKQKEVIAEKDNALAEKDNALAEKDLKIKELEKKLNDKK